MLDEEFGKSCFNKVDPKSGIPLMLSARTFFFPTFYFNRFGGMCKVNTTYEE
jgi:hypothetical protein